MPTGIIPLSVKTVAISAAGGDRITFDVPNDAPLSALALRAAGNITIATADCTATNSLGIANIFKSIRLVSKSETRLDVQGRHLDIVHLLQAQGSRQVTQPGITQAASPAAFDITLERFFQMNRMLQPWADQGILPNHLIRDVQLVVDIDTPSATMVPAGTTVLAYSGATVELMVMQARPAPTDFGFYVNEQLTYIQDTTLLTSTGDKDVRLNVGGRYRHLICIAESTASPAAGRQFNDNLVTQLVLKANQTEYARVNWNVLRAQNREQFLLPSTLPGVAVIDWTKYGAPNELFDARQLEALGNDLKLTVTVGTAAATSVFTVIPVRVFGNFLQIQGG